MNREEKSQIIQDLTARLADTSTIYLADISELDALTTSNLRRACFKANVQLAVVKNTLLEKAMEASDKDFGELPSVLKGNTSLMISETGNAPAKVIKEFRKKSDKPLLKGAFVEEAIYIGDDQLDALVNIKSREELIGDIVMLLQSPAKNVISGLKSGGGKLAGILKTLSEKYPEVIIATDPDREGEAIAMHLKNYLNLENKYSRVTFNEINEKAIQEAFSNPHKINDLLFKAQESRRILDRIIGFRLSKLLQKKIKSRSAGRVQSVALKIISEREAERSLFDKNEY